MSKETNSKSNNPTTNPEVIAFPHMVDTYKLLQKTLGITQEQWDHIQYIARKSFMQSLACANDNSTRQVVYTAYNNMWQVTYWRDVDNLIADSWSMGIAALMKLVIDHTYFDMPIISNVTPMGVMDSKTGEVYLNAQFLPDEDDDEETDYDSTDYDGGLE